MYLRTVNVPSSNGTVNEYVRVVESYRQDGKFSKRKKNLLHVPFDIGKVVGNHGGKLINPDS